LLHKIRIDDRKITPENSNEKKADEHFWKYFSEFNFTRKVLKTKSPAF
jgi:hypothetical protein